MASQQGVFSYGDSFAYLALSTLTLTSAGLGLDGTDSGKFKIRVVNDPNGTVPSGAVQFTIDPSTNGDVTVAPNGTGFLVVTNSSASAVSTGTNYKKSRSGGVISGSDVLGQINFQGFDGTNYITAATISSVAGSSIGTNQVGGNLQFRTHPNSTGSLATRMTIDTTGSVVVFAPDSGVGLTVAGGGLTATGAIIFPTVDGLNIGSVAKVVSMAVGGQIGTTTITAGTGISVTAGANTITLNSVGAGVTWSVITANQTAAVNNGYICNKGGTLALALPATSAVGDVIRVTGMNTALGWQITQAANQQIFIGTSSTTLGAAGTLTSSATRDSVEIVCIVANLTWNAVSVLGNITPA